MSEYTARQLLTGQLTSAVRLQSIQIERAGLETTRKKAEILDFLYEQDNYVIQKLLQRDLIKYMDGGDISRMKWITVDSFVPSFLKKICNVYDNPPNIILNEETGDKFKKDMDVFIKLMQEVRLRSSMTETFEKMRLHNTIVPYIKYNKKQDRLKIDNNYNVATSFVVTEREDSLELSAIGYEQLDDKHKVTWVVWDRDLKQHYRLKTKLVLPNYDYGEGFQGTKIAIGDNNGLEMPKYNDEYELPFVVYRYKNHNNSFWGNGMDFLSDLVMSINILLTVINDDSIQETLRLLLLNFNPVGTDGEKGQLKAGLRHPFFDESGGIGNDKKVDGKILSADLYNKEILKLIDKLVEIVASLHNIDSPLKALLTENLAGIAIRMRNEPLLRNWKNDINILRYPDRELLRKLILVNNYHRKDQSNKQINVEIMEHIEIIYAEPTIITDEQADYTLEQSKWKDGTSSPIIYLMKQNPALTQEKAEEILTKNLKDTKSFSAPAQTTPFTFKTPE